MSARALIWAAWPKKPAAHIMGSLGCSPRQAWRIVSTGRVPGMFRQKLIDILDEAMAANERELRQLRRELKGWGNDTSARAAASEDQMARMAGPDAQTLPGLDKRTT